MGPIEPPRGFVIAPAYGRATPSLMVTGPHYTEQVLCPEPLPLYGFGGGGNELVSRVGVATLLEPDFPILFN